MHKMRDRIPTEMQIACQDAINRTSLEPDIKALTNLIIDIKNMLEGVKGFLDEPTIRPQIFLSGNNYGSATTAKTLYHYTPAMLKSNAFHLEFRDQTCRLGGICNEVHSIEADPGLIFQLDQWWNSSHSDAFWIQPHRLTASAMTRSAVSGAATSAITVAMRGSPAKYPESTRSQTTTRAPSAAKRRVIARPIPLGRRSPPRPGRRNVAAARPSLPVLSRAERGQVRKPGQNRTDGNRPQSTASYYKRHRRHWPGWRGGMG